MGACMCLEYLEQAQGAHILNVRQCCISRLCGAPLKELEDIAGNV